MFYSIFSYFPWHRSTAPPPEFLSSKIVDLLTTQQHDQINTFSVATPDSPDCCSFILTLLSYLLIMVTLPISLCMCIKVRKQFLDIKLSKYCQVVQEYERAVIFRLGRFRKGYFTFINTKNGDIQFFKKN